MKRKINAGQFAEIAAAVGLCLFVSLFLVLVTPSWGDEAVGVFLLWLLSLGLAAGACFDVYRRSRAAFFVLCASGTLLAVFFVFFGLLFFLWWLPITLLAFVAAGWSGLPVFLALAERHDRQRETSFPLLDVPKN